MNNTSNRSVSKAETISLAEHRQRMREKKYEIAAVLAAVDEARRLFRPYSSVSAVQEVCSQLRKAEQELKRLLPRRPKQSTAEKPISDTPLVAGRIEPFDRRS